ncbi:sulfotransferase domain-containing protein [Nonomuraea terrae]|uniref:Sulfotransferase domain-containing protein n=1 Tax=Nonomuraea terrae TaxID=2530383 RepID=A0A4R4Z872_9ACTN|nr:sulfotransferase domain-containing protein [Nonomuraea terrae]TDD53279.1 sulfotransferase domain-containing protein [Nonomuraea terrae]
MSSLVKYRSPYIDSGRWDEFPFRQGDIVISTRSKSGTTWVQMICALLIFQTPDLPKPLPEMSPWLEHLVAPKEEVFARLAAQRHRRFIKTHTPLDGVPIDPQVTYIVVGRHPLDMAVSQYHMYDNLDRERLRALTHRSERPGSSESGLPLRDWLLQWMNKDVAPADDLSSLPAVMWHLSDAWERHLRQPNVLLVHYDDLLGDLAGEMRRLAGALNISVPEEAWPALVDAATFDNMKSRADRLAPTTGGLLKDKTLFFRRGESGSGRELLTEDELARYERRTRQLAPADLLRWLHR